MLKKKIVLPIIAVIVTISLFVTTIIIDRKFRYQGENSEVGSISLDLLPIEDQCLINEVIDDWIKSGDFSAETISSYYNQYREYGRMDYPVPVHIKFLFSNTKEGVEVTKKYIEISENDQFINPIIINIANHKNELDVYNLKTGMDYFYRVTVELSDGNILQKQDSFKTLATRRYCYIDGVRNVRDIGGYMTLDGKVIKQGLIYRGTELDGAQSEDGKFVITEAGIATMVNDLKIKHLMDLRQSNLDSPELLPSSVSHTKYSAYAYAKAFNEGERALKKIFTDLADESKYPMYVHCTYGCDRTGTIVYLMGAVLGMSEEDLYSEWALSLFFSGGSTFKAEMDEFLQVINSFEGDTLQEKVSGYLISIGITQEQLDTFRNIMLEH